MPSESQIKGANKETEAEQLLIRLGYEVIERNWRGAGGEIDRIAWDEGVLAFIEVRSRKGTKHGQPIDTIGPAKQRHLVRAASHYLQSLPTARIPPTRFDVVSVSSEGLKLIKDAFQVEEKATASSIWML